MNLELAVKFADWKKDNPFNWSKNWTNQQLFNYWMDNILKIEL